MRKLKRTARRPKPSDSFSLVELLVVMAIIAILASLILMAGNAVIQKGLRSRASAEIQAISAAAEGYKSDNGIYPQSDGVLTPLSPYYNYDGATTGDEYQTNSTLLYIALTGQTNYATSPASGTKVYLPGMKVNQIGNPTGPFSYLMDPWTHAYGYSTGGTGTATYPYNGNGFFDLWSTAGITQLKVSGNNTLTNTWLSNWTQ
jgi:prepilin-type N-terminal cleavage/methylation domain-containing protein